MSTSLRFSDIFKILAAYLQKTFVFDEAKLLLLGEDGEGPTVDMAYITKGPRDNTLKAKGIFPKLEVSSQPFSEHDTKVCALMKGDVRKLQIVRSQWNQNPYAGFLPEDAKTYMAVPMVIDNRLAGMLSITDLATSDFEKFSILSAQFALEMRRIMLYEKVEEMAITDGLTKAFAKRHMMERLGEEYERSSRHRFSLSFLMVDIDYFKRYNDTYGHLVGDVVLKDIVGMLKANTREVDLVGRFGGEEFCVILPETGKDEALLVSERIREIIEKHDFRAYDEITRVTVSIGIASYPEDCSTAEELVEYSDQALYRAKKSGRNKVCSY
jgi:diguanylate cyclase (GGDEF)-like protein